MFCGWRSQTWVSVWSSIAVFCDWCSQTWVSCGRRLKCFVTDVGCHILFSQNIVYTSTCNWQVYYATIDHAFRGNVYRNSERIILEGLSTISSLCSPLDRNITPQYSWNIAKVGVKHQSINQLIGILPCGLFSCPPFDSWL